MCIMTIKLICDAGCVVDPDFDVHGTIQGSIQVKETTEEGKQSYLELT